jgi:hypothetical protein
MSAPPLATNQDHLQIDMEQLAIYMFCTNGPHSKQKWIQLDLQGVSNTKDLYCMCLDLFCKGMVLMHGTDNKVYVDDLTTDQIQDIAKCMYLAGIQCHLDMEDVSDDDNEVEKQTVLLKSIQHIHELHDHLPMSSYSFALKVGSKICKIRFSIHHIPGV